MKNAVFWDIKTQFVPYRRHNTSPLQSPADLCYVRIQVFSAVSAKKSAFWNVTPCHLWEQSFLRNVDTIQNTSVRHNTTSFCQYIRCPGEEIFCRNSPYKTTKFRKANMNSYSEFVWRWLWNPCDKWCRRSEAKHQNISCRCVNALPVVTTPLLPHNAWTQYSDVMAVAEGGHCRAQDWATISRFLEETSIQTRLLKNVPKLCKIWGFHDGDYEEWRLLGRYAVWLL
jgi:hypothetical protein